MTEARSYILNKEETKQMMEDVAKGITCLFVIHFLNHFINGEASLLNERILRQILYFVVAITIYYLVLKRSLIDPLFKKKESE